MVVSEVVVVVSDVVVVLLEVEGGSGRSSSFEAMKKKFTLTSSPPQPCDIHRYTLKELVGIVQQEVT